MRWVSLEKFLPYVLPYAEKCPAFVARRAIRDTIIDLASRTHTSTTACEFSSLEGVHEYTFDMPHGVMIDMFNSVMYNGRPLLPTNRDQLGQIYQDKDWRTVQGDPEYYLHTDTAGELTLVPAPQKGGDRIYCEFNFSFTRDATEFPSEYYDRYVEVISYGALSRILGIPGQTFTDLAMAAQWANMYAAGVRETLTRTLRDYTKNAGRVFYRSIL